MLTSSFFSSLSSNAILNITRRVNDTIVFPDDVPSSRTLLCAQDFLCEGDSPLLLDYFTTLHLVWSGPSRCCVDTRTITINLNDFITKCLEGTASDYTTFMRDYLNSVYSLTVEEPNNLIDQSDGFKYILALVENQFSEQIKQLVVSGSRNVGLQTRNCTSRLVYGCAPLESLEYHCPNLQSLSGVWRLVGCRLQELCLKSSDSQHWFATLHSIRENCTRLRQIMVHNPMKDSKVSESCFVEFLASFGKQLKRATLPALSSNSCLQLATSCPNMRVSYFEFTQNFGTIASLGNCLEKLSLVVDANSDWGRLEAAMDQCRSLVSLSLIVNDHLGDAVHSTDVCCALFSGHLIDLEELYMCIGPDTAPLFVAISEKTGNLLSLTFELKHMEEGASFAALIRANPSLEDVWFSEEADHPDRATEADVVELYHGLLNAFKQCLLLRMFTTHTECSLLPNESSMRDLMVPFRNRGVQFQLHFQDYVLYTDDCVSIQITSQSEVIELG